MYGLVFGFQRNSPVLMQGFLLRRIKSESTAVDEMLKRWNRSFAHVRGKDALISGADPGGIVPIPC